MALQMAGGCWQIAKGGYIFGGSVMWLVFVIVWKILLRSKAYCFVVKTMMWKLQNVSEYLIVHDLYIFVGPPSFDRRVTYPLLRVAEWCTLFTQCGFKNVWHTPDEAPGVFLLVACCTKGFSYVQWSVFAIDTIMAPASRMRQNETRLDSLTLVSWSLLLTGCQPEFSSYFKANPPFPCHVARETSLVNKRFWWHSVAHLFWPWQICICSFASQKCVLPEMVILVVLLIY